MTMIKRMAALALLLFVAADLSVQNPPPGGRGGGGRGGGGRGRGGIRIMSLTTTAFPDGGQIPVKYAQPGHDHSPALSWSGAPDSTASFVLIVHDPDAAVGDTGFDDMLHWLVWNIPGTATSLPESVPQGAELPDGTRQISVSGPYYRGPGAPATGNAHHYLFELYALDTRINVAPTENNSPVAQKRAAIMTAMSGHVRGKAVMVGLFKRAEP